MNFSLVFENSGDVLPFQALTPEFLEFYVEQLEQQGLNSFHFTGGTLLGVTNHISAFRAATEKVNAWLETLIGATIPVLSDHEYLDQDNLNYIHAYWVRLQKHPVDIDQRRRVLGHNNLIEKVHDSYPDNERFPLLGDVIQKIEKNSEFSSLNAPWLHGLENKFDVIKFQCHQEWLEFNNPWPKDIATLDVCNLYLPFAHLGRTQYNKFVTYDQDYQHNDENTFNEILKYIEISLRRPETKPYSPEYLQWCADSGKVPSGDLIPLGNIPDLVENLYRYRILLLNNVLAKNNFQIHLNKG